MADTFEAEVAGHVVVVSPRALIRLAETWVRVRGRVALARAKRDTMTAIAQSLTVDDRASQVTSHEPDGTAWTITLSGTGARRCIAMALEQAQP